MTVLSVVGIKDLSWSVSCYWIPPPSGVGELWSYPLW